MKLITTSCILAALIALGGCASNGQTTNTKRKGVMGAAAGAVVGGIIGHQSGRGLEGAAIGGAVGGAAGATLGSAEDEEASQSTGR